MKKYNDLLTNIAAEHGIVRGQSETEADWKIRIIYSICGMMAYASLWDCSEETVSIVHLKSRIRNILEGYKEMYPEISAGLPYISRELENATLIEDEISNLFLSAGVAYHCPNRIAPSIHREAVSAGINLLRGIPISRVHLISGIGFYGTNSPVEHAVDAREMFGLEAQNLKMLWEKTVATANWIDDKSADSTTEFLRTAPPYTKGYWKSQPDDGNHISILRRGMQGSRIYYLYRFQDDQMKVSPLPNWHTDNHNYRALACACLASIGTLPSIEYRVDGDLVHLRLNYLLPPRELAFLKLYSWPERCTALPCDFKRNCTLTVFHALQEVLVEEGYIFKEE